MTVVTPQTQIDLRCRAAGSLQSVRSSANLNSVVRALNALARRRKSEVDFAVHAERGPLTRQTGTSSDDDGKLPPKRGPMSRNLWNELKAKAGQKTRRRNIRPVARQVKGMFKRYLMLKVCEALPKMVIFSSDRDASATACM